MNTKNILRKSIAGSLIAVSLISSSLSAFAYTTTFPDVNPGDWYYDTVMSMTARGLFAGIEEDGVIYFKPDKAMTRAEFLVVVSRVLELPVNEGGQWWEGAYESLKESGIVTGGEIGIEGINEAMPREEMAMVAIRAGEYRGESLGSKYKDRVSNEISDINEIGSYYRDYVIRAYENGILEGIGDGRFDGKGTLSRSAAATVFNKLLDASARKVKDYSSVGGSGSGSSGSEAEDGPIIIKEGEVSQRRFARAGDTVVKADGTEVVLAIGPHGVLGEGQGVAPDLGVTVTGVGNTTVTMTNVTGLVFSGDVGDQVDSVGMRINNESYFVNNITGEGHWGAEWMAMTSMPTEPGEFADQLSEDKNWYWDNIMHSWTTVYNQNFSGEIAAILEANGLN